MSRRNAIFPPPHGPSDPSVLEPVETVVAEPIERADADADWGQRNESLQLRPPRWDRALPQATEATDLATNALVTTAAAPRRGWEHEAVAEPSISTLLMSNEEDPRIVIVDALYPGDTTRLQNGVLYVRIGVPALPSRVVPALAPRGAPSTPPPDA